MSHNNNAHHVESAKWMPPIPPDVENGVLSGRLRACNYCGSMSPTDVVDAIQNGAKGSFADPKYGWPHKAYFHEVPYPHAGMLEVRSTANYQYADDWVEIRSGSWQEPPKPAGKVTMGKFYMIHLEDATQEEREQIETHLGMRFVFKKSGGVSWKAIEEN